MMYATSPPPHIALLVPNSTISHMHYITRISQICMGCYPLNSCPKQVLIRLRHPLRLQEAYPLRSEPTAGLQLTWNSGNNMPSTPDLVALITVNLGDELRHIQAKINLEIIPKSCASNDITRSKLRSVMSNYYVYRSLPGALVQLKPALIPSWDCDSSCVLWSCQGCQSCKQMLYTTWTSESTRCTTECSCSKSDEQAS